MAKVNLNPPNAINLDRVYKSMLADNFSWKGFDEYNEPLRTELRRKYKEDRCIVVVAVNEDGDIDDPVCAVGLLKVPEEDFSADDSDSELTVHIPDEYIDFNIGVMVVSINDDDNPDNDTDDDDDAAVEGGAGVDGGARHAVAVDSDDDDDGNREYGADGNVEDDSNDDESDDDSNDDESNYDSNDDESDYDSNDDESDDDSNADESDDDSNDDESDVDANKGIDDDTRRPFTKPNLFLLPVSRKFGNHNNIRMETVKHGII